MVGGGGAGNGDGQRRGISIAHSAAAVLNRPALGSIFVSGARGCVQEVEEKQTEGDRCQRSRRRQAPPAAAVLAAAAWLAWPRL